MYSYTKAESRERRKLFIKGLRQAAADNVDPALRRRIERIDQSAAERGALELAALHRVQADARQDLAAAKAVERAAPRAERAAAREARKQAEQRVRLAERAVHKAEQS
ncbi:hypothetical protein FHX79_113710 [Streptomyces cavourensis]|uniref:hypothetical protein n=1 Tax=Streptomyces cavourensis TaxID=67258 RepID=UPI00114E9030|nr:hypothetical protein [Streptomyces cavourensis]TQO31838.1 hypothetical protein FHX79_113710 [Streptomyces cavourensis]GGU94844.1 hypothetical protein GCM10010498_62930 [Streptomyces cavourensis]